MRPERFPPIWVAFGKVSDPATAIRNEGAGLAASGAALGRQVARIVPGSPAFRLNSPGWLLPPPELIGALSEHHELRLLCRDRLQAMTPGFAAAARRFVETYLDRAETLALDRTGAAVGLNAPADVFFEILLPLPSPQLVISGPGADTDTAPVQLDLAFWDGERLTGVLFGADNTTTPAASRDLDRLCDRLGPTFAVHRLTTPNAREDFVESLLATAFARPAPWFGPYRTEEFRAPLP